jgi:AraC family transcriptional regulator of adaptative response/methylated-DNA-[protein]-cysteine methyltransferase
MIKTIFIKTPLGEMAAAATKEGICFLAFSEGINIQTEINKLSILFKTGLKSGGNKHLRALKKQLKEYFKGTRKEFTLTLIPPGTEFQQAVWQALGKIPYGTTISYLEQAKLLNNQAAVRAVANSVASNRIAIIIPCHRVIGSDGSLTGYGGGLEKKQWLIEHEKRYSGKPLEGRLF